MQCRARKIPFALKEIQNKIHGAISFLAWFSSSNVPDVVLGGAFDPERSGANQGGLGFSSFCRGTYPLCAAVNFTERESVCVLNTFLNKRVHGGVYTV